VEELALSIVLAFLAIVGILVGGVALFERYRRRRVEALGRRRKERIRL